jgi:selenocysteine lyase/cysteine desulfurase
MNRREWLAGTSGLLAAGEAPGASSLAPRSDFPLAENRTYLNNAGYHPMSVQASRAVREYLTRRTEGTQEPAWEVSAGVKEEFAALINAKPAAVSYVTSTMVGENLVLAGLGIRGGPGNVVTDALHFEGSLYLYGSLQQQGLDVRVVKPRDWRIDLRDLEQAIDRNTRLVAVSLFSFLNGFEHDLTAVCALAHAHEPTSTPTSSRPWGPCRSTSRPPASISAPVRATSG